MNSINGIHPSLPPRPIEPANPVAGSNPIAGAGGVSDVVEISTAAALAAKIQQIPDIRADLVARVKEEIEAGTYETPERIEIAVDRLLEDLFPDLL
jgi:negative regulator of flagellin synthesis FlgM